MTDVQNRICEELKSLSQHDFIVSCEWDGNVKPLSTILHSIKTRRGVELAVSEPYKFESCKFDRSEYVFKVHANQFNFYPVFNDVMFSKYFEKSSATSWCYNGVVAVSHAFKMISLFYACELDGSFCYIHNSPTLIQRQLLYINTCHNGLYGGYRCLFTNFVSTLGLFTDIESFFKFKSYEKHVIAQNAIQACEASIHDKIEIIERLNAEIESENEQIDELRISPDAFDLDLNQARVEYDMMNVDVSHSRLHINEV